MVFNNKRNLILNLVFAFFGEPFYLLSFMINELERSTEMEVMGRSR